MPEKYRRPHSHERRQTVEDMERVWALSARRWPRSAAQAAAWGNSTAMRFFPLVSTIATRM
jgi:hypothetical protein